jgi:hypothetical protein
MKTSQGHSSMQLFRQAPLSMFTPQRATALLEFAQKAEAFNQTLGRNADCLVDMLSINYPWSKFLLDTKAKGRNPLVDSKGNLDFLAACIEEGVALAIDWGRISGSDYQNLQWDLARAGLHGLHFRMALDDSAGRLKHTMALAGALYDIGGKSFRNYLKPLVGLSVLNHAKDVQQDYVSDEFQGKHPSSISVLRANELVCGHVEGKRDEFKEALRVLLLERDTSMAEVERHRLAMRIENAFLPLVYNYGYRLKADGVSNEVVCQKASANIDALLDFLEMEPETHNALKRQVLINLFSAFPDGLDMLKAKPDELQGVMLDPSLICSGDANLFAKTLAGPVVLFSAIDSVKPTKRSALLIDFFENTNYPLDFETAVRGRLLNSRSIMELFSNSHPNGHSDLLEQALTGVQPQIKLNDGMILYLMAPARLSLYSDAAFMKLVALTLDFFKKQQDMSASVSFLAAGFYSIGNIFKDRPHLRDGVLELLVEQSLLKPKVFDWCNFGPRELKSLGKMAPTELKDHVLSSALGL